jgi:hypothetical protein
MDAGRRIDGFEPGIGERGIPARDKFRGDYEVQRKLAG